MPHNTSQYRQPSMLAKYRALNRDDCYADLVVPETVVSRLLIARFALYTQTDDRLGCAFGTACRLSVVCDVLYCGETVHLS